MRDMLEKIKTKYQEWIDIRSRGFVIDTEDYQYLLQELDKYKQPGICGYIHGQPEPEKLCKQVFWAKDRAREIKEKENEINTLVRENDELRKALKTVTDSTIRISTSNYCDKHKKEVGQLSYSEYMETKAVNSCPVCNIEKLEQTNTILDVLEATCS